jgi:hypothetical protein
MLVVGLVSFSFAQQKEKPIKEVGIAEETTWSPNFNQESIDNIAAKFGKHFNKKIIVSASIKGKKINLSLTKASYEDALKALTQPQGWQYIQDGDNIIILTGSEWQEEIKKWLGTKTYQVKYAQVQSVVKFIQPILSTYGKLSFDDGTKQILITDLPEVLTKIEGIIANLDIPTETRIISIRYGNIENVVRVIDPLRSSRGTINSDRKTNTIILSDLVSNLQKMETLITQIENDAKSVPQVNIDCSIIKVALNQKYMAGVDWTTCPFTAREMSAKTGVYLKNIDPNKLIEWLKIFGDAELISRKKATVVPGNPVSVREGAQYSVVVNYPAADTTKAMMSTRNTVDSGFTYTFNVQPSIDEKEKIIQLNYKVDGVLPEKGNRITYSVNVDNARIKDGYTLVTEDIRRLPIGGMGGMVLDEAQNLKYGSIDLILLITPNILQSEIGISK